MNRLYLAIGAAAVVCALAWHYDHLIDSNRKLRSDLSEKTAELEQSQALVIKERQNAQDAANRALALTLEESKNEEEYSRRTKCIADKSCGYVMRYKACPAVPGSAADQSQSTEAAAELERQFQRWSNDHANLIRRYETRVKALTDELIARSSQDYCSPK